MQAANNGHSHIVDGLLCANASVDLQSTSGTTALFMAAQSDRTVVRCVTQLGQEHRRADAALHRGEERPVSASSP